MTVTKGPNESILYSVSFALRLGLGETLTAINSVTVIPAGLSVSGATYSGQLVQVRLAGGTAGITYHVTLDVATTDADTRDGCFNVFVESC